MPESVAEARVRAVVRPVSVMLVVLYVRRGQEPSGSSSDEGGFARDAGDADADGAADSGNTLPVRNSRSVLSTHIFINITRRFGEDLPASVLFDTLHSVAPRYHDL